MDLDIEDLIRQAEEAQERWKKPKPEDSKPPRARSWKEILESRTAPKGEGYKV